MWTVALGFVMKRPWIIALALMGVVMGGMWINIQRLEGKINGLNADIVSMKADFQTCENNEHTLMGALDSCNTEISDFEASVTLMAGQVEIEKARVTHWQTMYQNKICFTPEDEVVVEKTEEVRVLNDEKNTDAVNRINDIFGN